MLLLAQELQNGIKDNPQIFADASSIGVASYEPVLVKRDGEYYLRHYLISANHFNTQNWKSENLENWVRSAIKKPLILAPGYHHIADPDRNTWLEMQKPFAIGSIEDILYNSEYNCYDAFTHITSDKARELIESGYMPKFVSPAILGKKIRYETENGKTIRIFEDAEIMHSAVVLKPAFRPIEMATIKDTACTGEKFLCKNELMAIAEDSAEKLLENNFAYLNRTFGKNQLDKEMPGENQNGSSHVDTLLNKFQTELAEEKRLRELEAKKNETLSADLKKIMTEKETIAKEKDDYKSKIDTYENEKKKLELKKSFEEKLRRVKMFYSDAELRSKKVDELVDKNFKIEDLDTIYENMYMTEDEIKETELKQKEQEDEKTKVTKDIGIAEDKPSLSTTLPTKKANAELIKGAMILDDILELRL